MTGYLLDTNVLSEPLKVAPNNGVLAALELHGSECAVPAPVWHELWYGALRLPAGNKRTMIRDFLEHTVAGHLPIVPYDEQAGRLHGELRAAFERCGRTLPFVDGQIAAIAVVRRLTLVTRDVAHFGDIPDLRVECWHQHPAA